MSPGGALEAIDRILNRGGESEDVLRRVVETLHERAGYARAAIVFSTGDGRVPGPAAGAAPAEASRRLPVVFEETLVAELEIAGAPPRDDAFLERVARLVSFHCRRALP